MDPTLRDGTLEQYCIVPEFRGRGYGRRLVGFLIKRLREEGVSRILTLAHGHPFFAPAHRTAESLGFEIIDRAPEFDVDKLLYQLEPH